MHVASGYECADLQGRVVASSFVHDEGCFHKLHCDRVCVAAQAFTTQVTRCLEYFT